MAESNQQISDTKVDKLCARCCQVKKSTEFGESELYVYDKELRELKQVMVLHESCARCRIMCKNLQQEVDKETKQVCPRCLEIKSKSDYGEYKTWAFTKDTSPVQEVLLPYKSCKDCRDKDKLYNKERRVRSNISDDTSSDDSSSSGYKYVHELGFSNM